MATDKQKSVEIPVINPRMREIRLAIIGSIVIAGIIILPFVADQGLQRQLTNLFFLMSIATMWNLVAGYAGLVSIGQQAWIGLGAYAVVVIADDLGVGLFPAVFLAGIFTLLLSIPTAWLVFRLRAGYFAIGTWVVAEVFRLLVSANTEWLGGGAGRSLGAIREFIRNTSRDTFVTASYYLAAGIAVLAIITVYTLLRSRYGLGLTATRDSEDGAIGLGINTYRLKLMAFAIAAGITGIAGGLQAVLTINVRPDALFSVQATAFMIFITVIGGIGTIEGPIIGAVIFYLLREQLTTFLQSQAGNVAEWGLPEPILPVVENLFSNAGEWTFILIGVIAVVMMLVAPQGIWGLIRDRTGIEIFPTRRLMPMRYLTGTNPSGGQ